MAPTFTCHRHKLRPGSEPAVAAYVAEMASHSEEIRQGLINEGVKQELVLLEHADDGDYLIFILECADFDHAVSVYMNSTADSDLIHRKFLEENVIEHKKVEVLTYHRVDRAA